LNFNRSNIIKVAIPSEHGSWGFFLEPIALSLLVAYSFEGLIIAISAFILFLANQPSSYIVKRKPKYLLLLSIYFTIFYLFSAIGIIVYFLIGNINFILILPFGASIFIMVLYKILEFYNLKRNIIVELIPQVSLVFICVSILLLKDWKFEFIIAFTIIVLSRSIHTVFYINNKLKVLKNRTPDKSLTNWVGAIFAVLLILFASLDFSPWLSLIAFSLLILRSIFGLFPNSIETVKIVGIKEFIYGFLFVLINVIGYNFNF
jgi:hypothetical protein